MPVKAVLGRIIGASLGILAGHVELIKVALNVPVGAMFIVLVEVALGRLSSVALNIPVGRCTCRVVQGRARPAPWHGAQHFDRRCACYASGHLQS